MNLKRPRVLVIFPLLALAGAAAILAVSCSKSSVNPPPASAGASTAQTSIANCIVDSNNDVDIGGPDALPGCDTAVLEPSSANPAVFGAVDVEAGGTLVLGGGNSTSSTKSATNAPTTYTFKQICINGGTVSPPNAKDTYTATNANRIVITFTGDRKTGPTDQGANECEKQGFQKGIDVLAGGTLILTGEEGVPSNGGVSWTTLAAPAGSVANLAGIKELPPGPSTTAGRTTLYLTADVTKGKGGGWQHDDWIVVASTDYNPFHSEFVQIDNANSGSNGVAGAKSWVTLKQRLMHYHFGSLAPSPETVNKAKCADPFAGTAHPFNGTNGQPQFLCDGATRNYGVDERAEVGLISRDLTLTAETATIVPPADLPPSTTNVAAATINEHWGGEIMIHKGFKEVKIQGVRLSKFGKAKLGSYPIHFHKVGNIPSTTTAVIDADSVDHSYNKCVTIHETSNLTIKDLVCARIVGHIFYEEFGNYNDINNAADSGLVFDHDLGIGAMSNSYDVYPLEVAPPIVPNRETLTRAQVIKRFFWAGDYMTNDSSSSTYINYDGFNIPDTDNQEQWVHGSCTRFNPDNAGTLAGYEDPLRDVKGVTTYTPCSKMKATNDQGQTFAYPIYIEPASGFWIQNPDTVLTDDAIAGCQGVGRGVWWVAPTRPIQYLDASGKTVTRDLKFSPLGTFKDNRVSGCYAGYYDEPEYSVHSEQLFPHKGGLQDAQAIIATLDGMTATRNRFRGVWLRPVWFAIKNSHFASNRENVSLVTSGGIDGNAPGVWDLLDNSVLVGFSQNNAERWGPCPVGGSIVGTGGGSNGCIDLISVPAGEKPHSGAETGLGYELWNWNDFGYMLYDGPVRVFHDRFVDFNYNKGWYDYYKNNGNRPYACPTAAQTVSKGAFYNELDYTDCQLLQNIYEIPSSNPTGQPAPSPYEGDAALGWFQSNQSAYPTGTASKELMWVNTNLRHQIYTELVGVNTNFNDGDKNTAIIDEDGTLSGLGVQMASSAASYQLHPFSLNNLPFNSTSNSVDECLSRGAQNARYEGRDTSLMAPTSMGTLEFSSLFPWSGGKDNLPFPGGASTHWQNATFTRTDLVPRYPPPSTTTFRPSMTLQTGRNGLGIWEPKVTNGYGYYVRVAPTTSPSVPPDIPKPYQSGLYKWIDVGLADVVDPNISTAHPFYILLGIDYKHTNQDGTPATVPAPASSADFTIMRGYKSYTGGNIWQNGNTALLNYWTPLKCHNLDANNNENLPVGDGNGKGYCPAGKTTTLTSVSSISDLMSNGEPNVGAFYYNKKTGYLWLYIVQQKPNPVGPSPLGSCTGSNIDPSCPKWQDPERESYYACPVEGCVIYTIAVTSNTYVPGPSTGLPAATSLVAPPPATSQNQLKILKTNTIITAEIHSDTTPEEEPYHTATPAPVCATTQSGP